MSGDPIQFSFDKETHVYTTAGQIVPSCTGILASGGLVSFDHVNRDILEAKSDLGRYVHTACHLYNQNREFICDDRVKAYVESWKLTREKLRFAPRLSEHAQIAVANGMQYGMQIDAEGLIQNEPTIIDYKIGQVLPHHGIQLAGYAAGLYDSRLETPLGRFRTRKRIVVQLQEDGSLAKIHRFEEKGDFDTFVSALFTTYWKMKHEKFYKEISNE